MPTAFSFSSSLPEEQHPGGDGRGSPGPGDGSWTAQQPETEPEERRQQNAAVMTVLRVNADIRVSTR